VSAEARSELLRAVSDRYRRGDRKERLRILDEFVATTGYHRKHAIRILHGEAPVGGTGTFVRARINDEAVRQALVVLWESSDRVCGKRLKPLLPGLVSALERHGHMQLEEAVRAKVLSASAATIDRVLAPTRASIKGRRHRRRAAPAVQRSVPVRTFADWKEPLPGFLEADLVAHCGEALVGSFVHTLTLTDIASGWTECGVLVVREAALVVSAVEALRTRMPFPLRGLDTDNGTEFMNETLLAHPRGFSPPA
jgi:hypothetical protein